MSASTPGSESSARTTPASGSSVDISGAKILVVDDTPASLDILVRTLEGAGYDMSVAPNGEVALEVAGAWHPDMILLDVVMPILDGYEVCRRLKSSTALRDIPVIFITAREEIESVVRGLEVGGVDYIVKPFRVEEVLARVKAHLERAMLSIVLAQRNRELESEITRRHTVTGQRDRLADRLSLISTREAEHWGVNEFVGSTGTVRKVVEEVGLLQSAQAISVLVTGESGTGKELIARAIHIGGERADKPIVPVNCSAIPADLADSMFFGHVRGAFTGADSDRAGYFEMANHGTLFLDEIGDLPRDLQPKLLRVLEDGVVRPLGANAEHQVDVRVISATNVSLQQRIAEGAFREDLYYRLARYTVNVPSLRERRDDIPLLVRHFIEMFALEMGIQPPGLHESALRALVEYDFPGNVRELKNLIERALIHSRGGQVEAAHLQFSTTSPSPPGALPTSPQQEIPVTFEAAERWVVQRMMDETGGNVAETAKRLGSSRGRIYRILKEIP